MPVKVNWHTVDSTESDLRTFGEANEKMLSHLLLGMSFSSDQSRSEVGYT